MGVGVCLQPWAVEPPPTTPVNSAHPLAPDFAWTFATGGGLLVRDIVQGVTGSASGNGWSRGRKYPGPALLHDTTTDQTTLAADSTRILPTGDCTLVIAIRKTDATQRAAVVFGLDPDVQLARCTLSAPYSDGNLYWDYGNFAGANRLTIGSLTYGDDLWAFVAGSVGMQVWQNGVLRGSSSTAVTRSASTNAWRLGSINAGTSDLIEYGFLYLYKRCLPPAAIEEVTARPYSMFAPARRLFAVTTPAAPSRPPSGLLLRGAA